MHVGLTTGDEGRGHRLGHEEAAERCVPGCDSLGEGDDVGTAVEEA